MTDPFRIEGPALISFSGGRTSGLMLRRILDAHGGRLHRDVHVVYANTGRVRCRCGARHGQGHALACPMVMERWAS